MEVYSTVFIVAQLYIPSKFISGLEQNHKILRGIFVFTTY